MSQEKAKIESALRNQKHEALIAQNAIHEMSRDITQLKTTKELLTKQWNDALTAMNKRDATFQTVQNAQEKTKMRIVELEKRIIQMHTDREEAMKALKVREAGEYHIFYLSIFCTRDLTSHNNV